MSEDSLKKQTATSLIWKMFERAGAQIIQFVVSIVLARLLCPEDYGAIALLTVFIAVASVFVQSGLSSALIRKQDADDLDYSSVFYGGLFVAIVIYVILFFSAPYIANFYKMPVLKNVLRVLSLTIVIGSYNSVQNVVLQKKMQFKKLFISSFSATIISGVVGITAAIFNFGIWALVIQQLSAIIATSIIMTFTVKWRPKLLFSFKRLRGLFKFGWKLLLAGILDVFHTSIYSLVIGRKYSNADLGHWDRGQKFPAAIVDNVNGAIGSVMYPVYSQKQGDKEAIKSIVRRSIKISSYLVFPAMMGMAICATPLIRFVLGEQWLPCVPFLQGWCMCYAFTPILNTSVQVYNALGRSDIYLYLEIVKKVSGIVTLLITMPFGLKWMMFGMICNSILCAIINAIPSVVIIKYRFKEQILDILPAMLVTCAMGALIYVCKFIPVHYLAKMAIQIVVGIVSYVALSAIFKIETYQYLMQMIKKALSSVKTKKRAEDEK